MTTQPTGASTTGPGLVEVAGLTKSYRSTPALRDYNLSLEAGHIVGLMGPTAAVKPRCSRSSPESSPTTRAP